MAAARRRGAGLVGAQARPEIPAPRSAGRRGPSRDRATAGGIPGPAARPRPPWPRSLTQVVHGGAASSGTGSTSRSLPVPGPPLSARNFSAASLGPERNAPPPGALGPAPHAPAPPPPRPASARPAGTGAALGGAAAPPRGPGDRWVAPLPVFFFSI